MGPSRRRVGRIIRFRCVFLSPSLPSLDVVLTKTISQLLKIFWESEMRSVLREALGSRGACEWVIECLFTVVKVRPFPHLSSLFPSLTLSPSFTSAAGKTRRAPTPPARVGGAACGAEEEDEGAESGAVEPGWGDVPCWDYGAVRREEGEGGDDAAGRLSSSLFK